MSPLVSFSMLSEHSLIQQFITRELADFLEDRKLLRFVREIKRLMQM